MDLLKGLVTGQGCAPDGAAVAQNPLGNVMQHMMESVPLPGLMGRAQGPEQAFVMNSGGEMHPDMWEGPGAAMPRGPLASSRQLAAMEEAWSSIPPEARHGSMSGYHPQMAHGGPPMAPAMAFHGMHAHHHAPPFMQFYSPVGMMRPAWMMGSHAPSLQRQHSNLRVEEVAEAPVEADAVRETSAAISEAMKSVPDERFQRSQFAGMMGDIASGDASLSESGVRTADGAEYDRIRAAVAELRATAGEEEIEAADFTDGMDMAAMEQFWRRSTMDYDGKMESAWQDVMGRPDLSAGDSEFMTYSGEYQIENMESNRYADMDDAFERGMQLFAEGQAIEAIRAFQSVVHKHPDHAEAWRMLGASHAENDEDKRAIVCLEKAVEQDPYNLEALAALGVSYVNEGDQRRALATLQAWVQHHPKYHGLKVDQDAFSDGTMMDDVMQLMLKAAEWDSSDAQVHIVLGVLYNLSRDYNSAVAELKIAADLSPDDYAVWNKIGATLANSNRSMEALPYYEQALSIKPGYNRGILNMGISLANVGNYVEAAKCYIRALQRNPSASHVWSYLRIVFTCMERFDWARETHNADIGYFARQLGVTS